MTDILQICDVFTENFDDTELRSSTELSEGSGNSWMLDHKEFGILFEELAKISSLLHSDGEEKNQILQEKLDKLTIEIENKEKNIEQLLENLELSKTDCERLKADILQQDEKLAELKEEANNTFVAIDGAKSTIEQQTKLLYMITRLTWDDKALKKNLIKGYVFNKAKNDVSVFETDAKKSNNKTFISDFLWDYISTGLAPIWNK